MIRALLLAHRQHHSGKILGCLLLALASLLGACSSGADSASDQTETADTSETVDAQVEEPVEEAAAAPADDEPVEATSASSRYMGSYTLMNEDFGTMVTVTVDGSTRTIESNALPDHETGDFPNSGNPNSISAQDLMWEFPVHGVYVGDGGEPRMPGVAVNGVKFEPGTAETVTCESGETQRVEALQELFDLGLDFNNAHVQPTGEYHYHGASQLLVDAYSSGEDLVHVGFAADGFLIYYSKSGAYDSGYALSTDARTGTNCAISLPGGDTFDLDGTMPDGTYGSDWLFDAANGNLDECNGTTVDGEYLYVMTDGYPYISRCLNGEFSGAGGPGQGAQGGQGEQGDSDQDAGGPGGGAPDMSEAAAALGISEAELLDVLGGPPPNLDTAAATLGLTVEELTALLPAPGAGRGGDRPARDDQAEPAEGATADLGSTGEVAAPGPNLDLFFDGALPEPVATVDCTLSGGVATTCYRITIAGSPANHEIGPFCPETVETPADEAGIWFDGNGIYDLDGEFIVGLAELYQDDNWKLYNDDGTVNITDTEEAFDAAARPNVAPEYQNHCVEGRIEWLDNGEPVAVTVLLPTTPELASSAGGGRGDLGVTLNGVTIAAAAPVDAILGAYTIAAFDDCGGHVNPVAGYHLHGAQGCGEVPVEGHAAIFAYALDGFAIHSPYGPDGNQADDLDACGGHTSDELGYHYHASPSQENAVIGCLRGQTAN